MVPRKVVLSADRFQTYHDFEKDPRNKKNWYLDRKCELQPKFASDTMPIQRKIVRPQSTWAITATVKQRGEEVKLVSRGRPGQGRAGRRVPRVPSLQHERGESPSTLRVWSQRAAWPCAAE